MGEGAPSKIDRPMAGAAVLGLVQADPRSTDRVLASATLGPRAGSGAHRIRGKETIVRARLATLAVAVTAAGILTAAAFTTAASARTVETFAIRNGITSVSLTVPHTTGLRPPAILLSTKPANLRCSVLSYRYHAIRRKGTFGARIRCTRVGRGARGRLVFRQPYVRIFKLYNGTATLNIRLDKFPGTAIPLGQLTTRPRATRCTASPTGSHVGTHVFTASARVRCRGLPRNAKAVLAVGGLLAANPSPATRSADLLAPGASPATESHTTASIASVKPCSSTRTLSVLGHSISWQYCYGAGINLGPWQSAYFGQGPTQHCASGWANASQVQPRFVGVVLANLYPPAVYVEPTSAWAWSYFWLTGTVTNWQFSGNITAMWSWNCYQVQ